MTQYQDEQGRVIDQHGHWHGFCGNTHDQYGGRYNAFTNLRNDWKMPAQTPPPVQTYQTPSPPSRNHHSSAHGGTPKYASVAKPSIWARVFSRIVMYIGFTILMTIVGGPYGLLISASVLPLYLFWLLLRAISHSVKMSTLNIVVISFFLSLLLCAAYRYLNPVTDSSVLSFRPACGSPPNSGSIWYGVVGTNQSLDVVKAKHCGDAYIKSDGQLQAASFTSRSEAEKFAKDLSDQTGYKFWVPNK